MRHLGLKVPLAAAALAALAGCGGCYHPPPGATLIATFTQPTDGQNLTSNQLPIDVIVQASDSSGGSVTIKSATLQIGAQPGVATTTITTGTINGSKVTFPKVALALPTNFLFGTVTDTNNRNAIIPAIKVTVGAPSETVTITTPASGAVLNAASNAADAGSPYQLAFAVSSTGLNGDHGVLSCPNACGIPPTAFTIGSNGQAAFNITLAEPSCEESSVTCFATVTDGAGQAVNSPNVTFKLDSVPPEIAIFSPVNGASAAQTFTVAGVVTCAEDGSTASLTRTGVAPIPGTVSGGVVSFAGVQVPADGTYDFKLTVTDTGGNVTPFDVPVVVESVPPTVALAVTGASPSWVISTDADGNAANGVQADVVVTVDSEAVGTEVDLWTTVTGTFAQPRRAVTATVGAHKQVTIREDLAEGANTLKVCVTGPSGLSTCSVQAVTVSTGRPTCTITSPADTSYFKGNPVAATVQAAAGASVTLNAVDLGGTVTATSTQPATGGIANFSLPGFVTGPYHLLATCPSNGVSQNLPIFVDLQTPAVTAVVRGDTSGVGNLGPNVIDTSPAPGLQVIVDVTVGPAPLELYSSVVVTGCGIAGNLPGTTDGTGKVAIRDVTVPQTGTGCTLTVTANDPAGNSGVATVKITPEFNSGALSQVDPAPGTILGADGGTGTGETVPVTYSFTSPNGGGTLTLSVNGTQVGSQSVTATDTTKTFANVQLAEGTNVLRAVLTDAAGSTSCTVALVYVNTVGAGSIAITQPGTGKLIIKDDLAPATPGIQYPLQYTASPKSTNFSVDICVSAPVQGVGGPCRDGNGYTLATNVLNYTALFTFPDGLYDMTAVLDDNGTIKTSPKVTLTVDSTRPSVTTVTVPADTNHDGILSQAELAALGGSPVTVVVTPSNLDANGASNVSDANNSTLYGQSPAYSGSGTITIPLGASWPATPDTAYNFVVNLTRTSGNPNKVANPTALDPLNTAAFINLNVDTEAPGVTLTTPSKTVLGIADDADPVLAGFQVIVTALVPDTDIAAGGIAIPAPANTTAVGGVQVNGSQATQEFTLTQAGGQANYTFNVIATDKAGNVGNASVTVTAVLAPPVVTITAPAPNPLPNPPYVTHNLTVTATVTGYNVANAQVSFFDGATLLGTVNAVGGTASAVFNFANGTHSLTAQVTDGAGNLGTSPADTPVIVQAPGCTILLTQPAQSRLPSVNLGIRDNPLAFQVQGTTPDCRVPPFSTATLCSGPGPCTGANTLDTQVANAGTGNFTFKALALADGSSGQLTVSMNNGVASTETFSYTVKLTPPVLSGITVGGVAPQPTVYFVAPSNQYLFTPQPPSTSYIKDKVGGPPFNTYATEDFAFTVTNANGGTAALTYGANTLKSVAINSDPFTFTYTSQANDLAQRSSGNLTFSAVDVANNDAGVTSAVAMVDVIPPFPVGADAGLAPDGGRPGIANLSWSAVGDDWTTTNAGGLTGYDVRWSDTVVLPAGIPDDPTYFDLTTPKVVQAGGVVQPPATTSYALTGLPPLNTYWIGVRAVDEVGNYSPYEPTTQSTYPATINRIDNFWTNTTFTNTGSGSPFFGFFIYSNGDLNGDGYDDLAVGSQTDTFGKVWVYYGGATPFSTPPQAFTPANAVATELFGRDLSIGNVGDDPGTPATIGRPDMIVGSKNFSAKRGRAFLYFGKTGAQIDNTTFIEFRGKVAVAGQFGFNVRIVPDFHGGTYNDLIINAPLDGTTGTVYLFKGRDFSAWQALATSTDTGIPGSYIPVTAADEMFTGDTNVQFLGGLHGYASVGDITGDGFPELTVPASVICTEKLFLFSSQTLQGAVGSGTPLAPVNALQTLSQTPQPTCGSSQPNYGFGAEALSAPNLLGNTAVPDLIVSQPYNFAVYLYPDATSLGFTNPPAIIQSTPPNYFGFELRSTDLNGDGRPDLVIGENPPTNGSSAWLFFNKKTSGSEFDLTPAKGFAQSRLSSGVSPGIGVSVGDFNGDGLPDLVVSDPVGNTMTIWY